MKIRLLLPLVGLAIGFALLTIAQRTNTPDPKLRDELVAFNKNFDDAFLKGDATAVAASYTEDACYVDPAAGPIYGRKAIEKYYKDLFQKMHFTQHASTVEQYSPHIMGAAGNVVWTTGEWNSIFQVEKGAPMQAMGRFLNICVREGDAWKLRVDAWNGAGPPTPAETK